MKSSWMKLDLGLLPLKLALCTDDERYQRFMSAIGVGQSTVWLQGGCDATTHQLQSPDNHLSIVVCVDAGHTLNPIEIACLIVHEAVHVWQFYVDYYGEDKPGSEHEAYSIQIITQRLMESYVEQKFKE